MVVLSSAKPTKLDQPINCDENVELTVLLPATGEKKLDVEYLLDLVENILRNATDVQASERTIVVRHHHDSGFKSVSSTFKQISYKLSTACIAQGDEVINVEKTAEEIEDLLSSYSLDGRLALSIAELALEFGELWRLRKDLTDDKSSLPKEFCLSMAMLKFVSGNIDPQNQQQQKPAVLDELNNLIMLILEVAKSIFELEKLRTHYPTAYVPGLLTTIQKHVHRTITSIVACAAHIAFLRSYEGQPQRLSQWTEYLTYIHVHLQKHRRICEQQKETEVYWKLISIFRYPYHDQSSHGIVDILKLLISAENDPQLLHISDGGTTIEGVSIDILSEKNVLLLISNLDISEFDIENLKSIYEGIKDKKNYKMVWIPIVEQWTLNKFQTFFKLRDQMPWYVVQMVSPLVGIRFIIEEWHFNGKPIVVLMNQQGEVGNPNALPLIHLRGMEAFPFTKKAEEDAIRSLKNWLHLVAKYIHPSMQSWMDEGKYIFFYGGTNQHWIKKFQGHIKNIDIGKFCKDGEDGNNAIESTEIGEGDEMGFWTIIESLYSIKVQEEVKGDDETRQVLQKLLSHKIESGWAVLAKGSTVLIADQGSKISKALKKLVIELQNCEGNKFQEEIFETAFKEYYKQAVDKFGQSCEINIPGAAANIPNTMKCLECGEVMETFIRYRCNKNSTAKKQNASSDIVKIKTRDMPANQFGFAINNVKDNHGRINNNNFGLGFGFGPGFGFGRGLGPGFGFGPGFHNEFGFAINNVIDNHGDINNNNVPGFGFGRGLGPGFGFGPGFHNEFGFAINNVIDNHGDINNNNVPGFGFGPFGWGSPNPPAVGWNVPPVRNPWF